MKSFPLIILAALVAPAAYGQTPVSPANSAAPTSAMASPAEQSIAWAKAAIKANPSHGQSYNDLAFAYVRRVRETSDTSYYDQAQAAVEKSEQMIPNNFEAGKAEAMILLGRQEFAKALDLATSLNKRTPDDVLVYGLVADANIALGNYKPAERAIQWMLDIRPGNVPGLLRAALLRRLHGDAEGAMDFYNQSYEQTPQTQTEDLAWILTQMGDLQASAGNLEGAEKLLRSALDKFPNYYLAVESLAQIQMAEQRPTEAARLIRDRNRNFPTPESDYLLAKVLASAGQAAEANAAYAAFERESRAQIDSPANANVALVDYYLDRGKNPGEALRIARLETAQRQDLASLDAYAWALYANGQYSEAQQEIGKVLALGVRDATFFFHAGAIAARMNDGNSAVRFLNESLGLNPSSEIAAPAREERQKLPPAAEASRTSASDVDQVRETER